MIDRVRAAGNKGAVSELTFALPGDTRARRAVARYPLETDVFS